jgi:hypothetical protein
MAIGHEINPVMIDRSRTSEDITSVTVRVNVGFRVGKAILTRPAKILLGAACTLLKLL